MQTEMQNCLAEAHPYAIEKRGPVIPTGSGPWELRCSRPIFCQSTDAFAGLMLIAVERFQSPVTARLAMAAIGDPGDDYYQLFGPREPGGPAVPAPQVEPDPAVQSSWPFAPQVEPEPGPDFDDCPF